MKKLSLLALRTLLSACTIAWLSGCVVVEPVDLSPSDRVGVYVEVSNTLKSGYMGSSVFLNESGDIDVILDRVPKIRDQIRANLPPHVELIDRNLYVGYEIKKLTSAARDMSYDYVIFVRDGRVCLDAYCNRIFTGSGEYGNFAIGRRFASNLVYRIYNTETNTKHYDRDLTAYFELPEVADSGDDDSSTYEYAQLRDALHCLDQGSLRMAMQEMNQVAPLFEFGPGQPGARAIDNRFMELPECAFD